MLLDVSAELLMFLAISCPLLQPLLQKSALTKLPFQFQSLHKSSNPILRGHGGAGVRINDPVGKSSCLN